MALHHHPELVRTTARPVIELAVSVMIAAHRLPEIIQPRRIFRDVGLLRAIAVARQIPVGQISGSNQTFTFSGIRFLLLTILKPFQPFNRCRSDRCLLRQAPFTALPTQCLGGLPCFRNSRNAGTTPTSQLRHVFRTYAQVVRRFRLQELVAGDKPGELRSEWCRVREP